MAEKPAISNNRKFHPSRFLRQKSGKKLVTALVVAVIFVALTAIGITSYSQQTTSIANDYTSAVKKYSKMVFDDPGTDAKAFTSKYNDVPKLQDRFAGSLLSNEYKQAKNVQVKLNYYSTAKAMIKDQSSQSIDIYKKFEQLIITHRKIESDIITKQKKAEESASSTRESAIRGLVKLDTLKKIRTSTTKQLLEDKKKHINEAQAVKVSKSIEPAKQYHISVLKKDRDLLSRFVTQDSKAKTYSALDRSNNRYRLERQSTSNETAQSAYSIYALATQPLNDVFALQYAMRDDLFKHNEEPTDTSLLRAKIAYSARYARSAFTQKIQADNLPANTGIAMLGIFQIQQLLKSSEGIDKKTYNELGKLADTAIVSTNTSLNWSQIGKQNPIIASYFTYVDEAISDFEDVSGIKFAANRYETYRDIKGTKIELSETKQFTYYVIDNAFATSPILEKEQNAYKSTAKKCTDLRVSFSTLTSKQIDRTLQYKKEEDKIIAASKNNFQDRAAKIKALQVRSAPDFSKISDEKKALSTKITSCSSDFSTAQKELIAKGKASAGALGADAYNDLAKLHK